MAKHEHIRQLIDKLTSLGDTAFVEEIRKALTAYESFLLKRAACTAKGDRGHKQEAAG